MLNTILFDMGGTLEDIWYNDETKALVVKRLMETLRSAGLEPGCSPEEFRGRGFAGVQAYKDWSEKGYYNRIISAKSGWRRSRRRSGRNSISGILTFPGKS